MTDVRQRVAFARFRLPETLMHSGTAAGLGAPTLIWDVSGEIGPPLLRDRLTGLHLPFKPEQLILRGVSSFLRQDLATSDAQGSLQEALGTPLTVSELLFDPVPRLQPIGASGAESSTNGALIRLSAQLELEANAIWSEAVWTQPGAHFVLPSGEHADRFVRAGDLFADPVCLSRVADWALASLKTDSVLVADNHSLLPLLQEVQIRLLRRGGIEVPRYVLPSYGLAEEEFVTRLANIAGEAARRNHAILLIVSVYSTGQYVRRIEAALKDLGVAVPLSTCILFTARREPIGYELCHLPTETYTNLLGCALCKAGSATIAIDQLRFTTRVGTTVLRLPPANLIEDQSFTISDVDSHEAFRVHVHRTDRHKHLTVFVDTEALLKSEVFRAHATIGWARCVHNFEPDLVIIPQHDGTEALGKWLESKSLTDPLILNLEDRPNQSVQARIASAERILLCDDAVITGRSLIAANEVVQSAKAAIGGRPYLVKAFVLLARPATYDVWQGLRSRFFVDHQQRLFSGWELYLPDAGAVGQGSCPWCDELRLLERTLQILPNESVRYLESRIQALRDPAGLRTHLFLGSEVTLEFDPARSGTKTTGGSYLGDVSDVAAFVAAAALIQRMRNDWDTNAERWSRRYVLPLNHILQRFTDPVIAASLLRVALPHELNGIEDMRDVVATLQRMGHPQQYPVLAAEVLLAMSQRKLPNTSTESFTERLVQFPDYIQSALNDLFTHTLSKIPQITEAA